MRLIPPRLLREIRVSLWRTPKEPGTHVLFTWQVPYWQVDGIVRSLISAYYQPPHRFRGQSLCLLAEILVSTVDPSEPVVAYRFNPRSGEITRWYGPP